jgi:hypothetical protein
MALPATEIAFIKQIFQPIVDMHVTMYFEDGLTLEEAWTEMLKAKPSDTTDEVHDIMQDMFNDSWADLKA